MPSKKQEIRKQVKKKLKKEGMEHQELNQEAEIVDLGDHRGDDIIVESITGRTRSSHSQEYCSKAL